MDFPVAQPIQDILLEMVSHSDLGYLSSIPELGSAFSNFAKRRWNWKVIPEYVRLCTDVGVGMVEVLRVTTSPGDKVLVNSPIYQNFYNWIKETKVELIDIPFIQNGLNWSLDFEAIRKSLCIGFESTCTLPSPQSTRPNFLPRRADKDCGSCQKVWSDCN
jgi:cystathionine beta-lyase